MPTPASSQTPTAWAGEPFYKAVGLSREALWKYIQDTWHPTVERPDVSYDGSWTIQNPIPDVASVRFGFDGANKVAMIYAILDKRGKTLSERGPADPSWYVLKDPKCWVSPGRPGYIYEVSRGPNAWAELGDRKNQLDVYVDAKVRELCLRMACVTDVTQSFDVESKFDPNSGQMRPTYRLKAAVPTPVCTYWILAPKAWIDGAESEGKLFSTYESRLKWVGDLNELGFREKEKEPIDPSVLGVGANR